MAYFAKQYAITTSPVTLTSAMGLPDAIRAVQIDIKNKKGNTTIVYLGKSDVTNAPANAGVEIDINVLWQYQGGDVGRHISTDEIYIVGTVAADPVFIQVFA